MSTFNVLSIFSRIDALFGVHPRTFHEIISMCSKGWVTSHVLASGCALEYRGEEEKFECSKCGRGKFGAGQRGPYWVGSGNRVVGGG